MPFAEWAPIPLVTATVRGLTFTGSTAVGKRLAVVCARRFDRPQHALVATHLSLLWPHRSQACAQTVKRVSLELGGNAPFIVMADADLDAAVEGALACKFRNTGQTCVCANRFLVHEAVVDAFADAFAKRVSELKVGDGLETGTQLGPLISRAGLEKVEEHVRDAAAAGARVLAGGRPHARGGLFYEATVLVGVTPDMLCFHEETFGPVAPISTFTSEAEALALANDTPFGLAGYVYTRSLGAAWRLAEGLECGIVGVNTGLISTESAPFGGMKESGLGREGAHEGLEEFLETKYVAMGGLDS